MTRTTAITAEPICTGTAIFISFFTPASEVYVEAPVKFIARNEEKLDIKNISAIFVMRLPSREWFRNSNTETITPMMNPLKEKFRVGIYGRSNGVRTNPARYPAAMIFAIGIIFLSACWIEYPFVLIPESTEMTISIDRR
jgi:hypothetical protein